MPEAENQDVATEEVVEATVEAEAEVAPEKAPEPPKDDAQARNWAETRAALKEYQREIKELRSQLQHRDTPKQAEPDIYAELGINKDDLGTGEHLAKLYKELKSLKNELQKKEASSADERLRLKYPDFDQMLSEENVQYLLKNEPTLVESIKSNPDPYKQAEAAYRLAKRFCPRPEDESEAKENMKKIAENQAKPMSSSAVKKSSVLDQAHQYTSDKVLSKEGRDHYYKLMQEAKRQPRP